MTKVLYNTMGWEADYTYRIPCQTMQGPGGEVVLLFDLDNYVGRAINKSEEVIIARKQTEADQDSAGKSYFYPPEEDDEPQEIREMEEKFQRAVEINKKIFGVPAFEHQSSMRGFIHGNTWDMMTPAQPMDINHTIVSAD